MFGFSAFQRRKLIRIYLVFPCFDVQNKEFASILLFDTAAYLLLIQLLTALQYLVAGITAMWHNRNPSLKKDPLLSLYRIPGVASDFPPQTAPQILTKWPARPILKPGRRV